MPLQVGKSTTLQKPQTKSEQLREVHLGIIFKNVLKELFLPSYHVGLKPLDQKTFRIMRIKFGHFLLVVYTVHLGFATCLTRIVYLFSL